MNKDNLNKLISESLAIEARDAKESGALGYMARALVQATLPHSKVEGTEFVRKNGAYTLFMLARSEVGLPYGSIPRLLMAWLTTEAVKTKNRELVLGHTLSEFMAQLDLVPTGGRWGTITRLREQMVRLFAASVSCTYDDGKRWAMHDVKPVTKANLWWDPKSPQQVGLFESTLTLGEDFFNEVTTYPIPIDIGALKAIKRSPMALDIYCWLTYRMSYLKKSTVIPWEVLQIQFGAGYPSTTRGKLDFKRAFIREMKKVHAIYRDVKVSSEEDGLVLHPSKPHISKK